MLGIAFYIGKLYYEYGIFKEHTGNKRMVTGLISVRPFL